MPTPAPEVPVLRALWSILGYLGSGSSKCRRFKVLCRGRSWSWLGLRSGLGCWRFRMGGVRVRGRGDASNVSADCVSEVLVTNYSRGSGVFHIFSRGCNRLLEPQTPPTKRTPMISAVGGHSSHFARSLPCILPVRPCNAIRPWSCAAATRAL